MVPKGVMLTHRNMVANLLQSDGLEPYQGDTFVGILPMYHIYGTWAFLSQRARATAPPSRCCRDSSSAPS